MKKFIIWVALPFMGFLGFLIPIHLLSGVSQIPDIWVAISGNAGAEDDFNPLTVINKKWPQSSKQTLSFINYNHPHSLKEISSRIGLPEVEMNKLLSSLQKCGLIWWDLRTGYHVTFAIVDEDVWTQFKPIVTTVASAISAIVSDDLFPLLKVQYERSRFHKLGMSYGIMGTIIIGAFGLDEAGIYELQQKDLVKVTKKQPGDRNYIVLSGAAGMLNRFPLYGIHAATWEMVYYATFGENQIMNRRRFEVCLLPDLIWNWPPTDHQQIEKESLVLSLSELVKKFGNNEFSISDIREILPNETGRTFLEIGLEYGFVEKKEKDRYSISFPIFSSADLKGFQEVIKATGVAVLGILQKSYAAFEEAYLKTNPSTHGIPLQEVLDLV
jgi:hypothetical protein